MPVERYRPPARPEPPVHVSCGHSPRGDRPIQVWMASQVENFLWRAGSSEGTEQGGLLYGRVFETSRGLLTVVYCATHLRDAWSEVTRITLSVPAQIQSDEVARMQIGPARRVGFWHTHPGMEPIPSRMDLQTMKRDCAEPWLLEIILDPFGSPARPPALRVYAGPEGTPIPGILVAPRWMLMRSLRVPLAWHRRPRRRLSRPAPSNGASWWQRVLALVRPRESTVTP